MCPECTRPSALRSAQYPLGSLVEAPDAIFPRYPGLRYGPWAGVTGLVCSNGAATNQLESYRKMQIIMIIKMILAKSNENRWNADADADATCKFGKSML